MSNQAYKWLNRKYPQNYIIQKPYIGTAIIAMFCLGFVSIYKPLNTHEAVNLSYEATMAIYCFGSAISVMMLIKVLKMTKYFSIKEDWTLLKELVAITIILLGMGLTIYFIAFFMEASTHRWNVSTFLDSVKYAYLIGIIPFAFFTILNYRYLLPWSVEISEAGANNASVIEPSEKLIQICSKLKKEELSFYPSQFIYASSDSNYVDFYLHQDNKIKKETIRNSISSIEQQLSEIPYIVRTHRAYIVNLKKILKKQGNTLGYRLEVTDIDSEIPVSRQNTRIFDNLFKQYH